MCILVDKHITIVLKLRQEILGCEMIMDKRTELTIKNLEKNNFKVFYAEKSTDAVEIAKSLLKEGDTITAGGSVTLKESGVSELFTDKKYNFMDRSAPGLTHEEKTEICRKAFFCDVYFASTNALTVSGQLYNVDGDANRISAMLYGPESVVLVVGKNKIVDNLYEAVNRLRTVASPKNTVRLNKNTYCAKTGKCVALTKENAELCDGCDSSDRICRNFVVLGPQRIKDRIKIILVNENLGY